MTMLGCKENNMATKRNLDIQGHRGCRGLMPENTIVGFKKALDLGVNTLELDLVVNAEGQVLISHEPFFNHEISTAPDGSLISKDEELSHNIFVLSQQEIEQYDVGLRIHPRFPLQAKTSVTKPLLREMIQQVDNHAAKNGYAKPHFNMEIKRSAKADDLYHPKMEKFADIVIREITEAKVMDRTTVQCFNFETLKYINKMYPDVKLVYLTDNKTKYIDKIEALGFTPHTYSPNYQLVDENMVKYCHDKNIKLTPWTVNKAEDVERLILLGVDGIISDFPDMVIEINESI